MDSIAMLRRISSSVALVVVPFFVFALILKLRIPDQIGELFLVYSFPLLLFVFALFLGGFLLKGYTGWLVPACLVMMCYAIPLSYKWTSGYSDAALIAGSIPYKDGFYYLAGARSLLEGHRILAGFYQAAWRPLFPGYLSAALLLLGNNLRWVLASLVALVGLCSYFSAYVLRKFLGALPAAVYLTLLFLFFQNQIGDLLSESLGLALGCLALILLWNSARSLDLRYLLPGVSVLMIAVSVRAGAFLIFPLIILWAGWAFRGKKRFSFPVMVYTTLAALGTFLVVNVVYPWLVASKGTTTNGNFSNALYGQVLGGVGWTQAGIDINNSNASTIYHAALQYFFHHPQGLLIGSLKAYRDFFLPGPIGIFSFISPGGLTWVDISLWIGCLILLVLGLARSIRQLDRPIQAFILAVFLGNLLSIPFLPPIDGGRRFFASTMPFLVIVMVIGISGLTSQLIQRGFNFDAFTSWYANLLAGLLISLTIFVPVFILLYNHFAQKVQPAPNCPSGQVPFIVAVPAGSYVDLIQDGEAACGSAAQVCLSDFWRNGQERNIDDFFQKLYAIAKGENPITRIFPAYDLIEGGLHYFIGTPQQLEGSFPGGRMTGCATTIGTATQSIYMIQTVIKSGSQPADQP
jgi:hypothetical protein